MYLLIDDWNSVCDHVKIKIYYLRFKFNICMIARQWIDCRFYYYVHKLTLAQSLYDYSKIKTLFGGDWSFRQYLRSIYCWWLGKQWTGCCWARGPTFWGRLKTLADEKALNIYSNTFFCTKLDVCRKHQW